ncbi:MAG TPA: BolA/IbaG family iron-sulfur metabolism protein [Cellvibrionaceae bacterium]|nr:BolA/IbaG family iron-sulfur metabolism protein [Cellvibrionaceae bacterium]HMW72310.1 BolA/IbaG family iron-sulfur metabolism protein [Cellvibrionaceae bacterium]HMY37969.1 BolA/IbaG family iron-sulfur metabolism protein [Marinagarivorans sp.]HNG61271.1 BolA/IbaG family iron-sulfur metabolism protein [Cellvibrionaceae bacterium]
MQEHEVITAVSAAIADAQVQVRFEGNHVHLRVISPAFTGLSPVKKQQLVYGALKDAIASGAIHAVHMQTLTPEEWAAQAQ